jgi:transposase
MTGDTTVSKVSRLEVIQTGSRRRWTLEEKLRIVAESMAGPRLVCAVARRRGLSANQLFVWRRLYREGKLGGEGEMTGFIPAIVSSGPDASAAPMAKVMGSGRIEIVLSEPRRLIVEGDVDAAQVARIAAALTLR